MRHSQGEKCWGYFIPEEASPPWPQVCSSMTNAAQPLSAYLFYYIREGGKKRERWKKGGRQGGRGREREGEGSASLPTTGVVVQLLSHVPLFATPWSATLQASLSITNSWIMLRLMSIESVMPSNHLILCHPLLLLPSIFPSIRVFSNESAL